VNAGQLSQVTPGRLRQPVHIAAAGDLTVEYHVIFTDGAELTGTLHFRAGPGRAAAAGTAGSAAGTEPPQAVAQSPHLQHGVDPISAALLALDGIVAIGAVVLLTCRPRPRPPVDSI
jgi:hypothetical protein